MESTGAWYWLADALAVLAVELVLAHATRVKAIAAAKVKTDTVDSDTLALLLGADPGEGERLHHLHRDRWDHPLPPARQFFSCCRLGRGRTTRGGALATARGSNAGSRYLKLTFSHAGIRAVQYYAEIRAFFKAKARKKPIRIVRILVALELAGIVYHVLATQQAFTGQFKGRTLSHRMPAKWPRRASPAA